VTCGTTTSVQTNITQTGPSSCMVQITTFYRHFFSCNQTVTTVFSRDNFGGNLGVQHKELKKPIAYLAEVQ
jgi:hypothetical protein